MKKFPLVYQYPVYFENKIELLRKVLSLYFALNKFNFNKQKVRPRVLEVLSFYILEGYNSETKKIILESLDITRKNLNQINSELNALGFLVRDNMNFRKQHLSKEMVRLRDYFLSEHSKKSFLIQFFKEKI